MGLPRSIARKLDDEELFNLYYIEMGKGGSIPKIRNRLAGKGTHVTTSAVWQAINRHLARNHTDPKVKGAVQDYYKAYGEHLSDDEFYWMVSKHARTCFAVKQYENWLKEPEQNKIPDLSEL